VTEFPSNSYSAREAPGNGPRKLPEKEQQPEKKVEPIVTGKVIRRKRPLGKRFAETFFGGETQGVLGYVVMEVILPHARDLAAETVNQAIDRMLYGDRGGRRSSSFSRPGGANYVNYNRFSSSRPSNPATREDPRQGGMSRRARERHDFDEIAFATRPEAMDVLDRLNDYIARYESTTVADFYGLVDISSAPIDDKWGWTDLSEARVIGRRGGYIIELPPTTAID
jgi:hypothetical protein